jgi:SPP1 gp7 family putative phage head morphogenesis protein
MDIPEDVLRVAFRLPPEKAQKYLEGKGYTFSWSWKDTWERAHARAFTVAKAMRRDVLESIRQVTERALRDGITFDRFQKTLEPYLKLAGWWGRTWPQNERGEYLDEKGEPWPVDEDGAPLIPADARPPLLGSPHRLATIYRQNLQSALNVGRYGGMMDVAEKRPYWQYSSVVDNRTTGLCRSLDGKVYRHDDAFWTVFYPPNHWRCRARVSSLSQRELDRDGLTVESGEAALTISTNKAGESLAQIQLGAHVFATDAGFAYNPGRAALAPFTPRMLSAADARAIKTVGAAVDGASPLAELPTRSARDFDIASKRGWTDEDYAAAFLAEFGAGIGTPLVAENVLGDALVISDGLFRDANGRIAIDPAQAPHLRRIADTLKNPAEVWLTWAQQNGRVRLVERYMGIYEDKKQQTLVTVDFLGDSWHAGIASDKSEIAAADKRRAGTLLYYRNKRG